jgi:hypothetical protein
MRSGRRSRRRSGHRPVFSTQATASRPLEDVRRLALRRKRRPFFQLCWYPERTRDERKRLAADEALRTAGDARTSRAYSNYEVTNMAGRRIIRYHCFTNDHVRRHDQGIWVTFNDDTSDECLKVTTGLLTYE